MNEKSLKSIAANCPCGCEPVSLREMFPVTFCYGSSYALRECGSCGTAFFDPPPSIQDLHTFYSIHGYDFNQQSQAARARFLISRYLIHRTKGRFLDIGCATGFLLKALSAEISWEVHGVELVTKAAEFAKNTLGLSHVLNVDLEGARYPDGYFDVVHISEVLEHVTDPLALLRECRRIIKPDGLFFLSLPNGRADRQGLIDYWKLYQEAPGHASGHIFFFSSVGLINMLKCAGFKVVETRTYAFKQGLRSLRLFPKRPRWQGMFEPRKTPEISSDSEISIHQKKYSEAFYRIKYGLRQRLAVSGLRSFGLGWDLVLEPRENSG